MRFGRFFLFIKKCWWVITVISILLVVGFLSFRKKETKAKPLVVKRQDLKESLTFSGQIAAEEDVVLRFQSSGKLTWVGVKEGDRVKKFQVIANLDQVEIRKKLQKYLNSYSKTRNDFEQTSSDNKDYQTSGLTDIQKDSVKRTIDDSQKDLNNAVIDVELQDLALKYSYLYTPISGIVTRVNSPLPGVNITPSQAEFEIVNPDTIYFSALADQTEVIRLHEGMKAEVTLDAYSDKKIEASVKSIAFAPKTGETGTIYEVKLVMSTNGEEKRLGMTGDVNLLLDERKSALTVPSKYIKEKKYVLKMEDGKLQKTEVTLGKSFDGQYEVLSGLKEGETIYDQAL